MANSSLDDALTNEECSGQEESEERGHESRRRGESCTRVRLGGFALVRRHLRFAAFALVRAFVVIVVRLPVRLPVIV